MGVEGGTGGDAKRGEKVSTLTLQPNISVSFKKDSKFGSSFTVNA